jgi:hypothetical protein
LRKPVNRWRENKSEDPGARANVRLAICRFVKKVHVVGSLGTFGSHLYGI